MEIILLILVVLNLVVLIPVGMVVVRIRDALVENKSRISNVDETIIRFLRENPNARIGNVREFVQQCVKSEPEQVAEILIPYYRARVNS